MGTTRKRLEKIPAEAPSLVFSSQNQPLGATVGMQRSLCLCQVSWSVPGMVAVSCVWDVPRAWHSRVGTAAALVAAAVTRPLCVLQESIPELELEGLCMEG